MFRLIKELQKVGCPKGLLCLTKLSRPSNWWTQWLWVQGEFQGNPAATGGLSDRRCSPDNGGPGGQLCVCLCWQEVLQGTISWCLQRYLAHGKSCILSRIGPKLLLIQDLVDGNTLTSPSLSVTTRVVYEVTSLLVYYRIDSLHWFHIKHYIFSGRK